jgi:anti-sigma-K factor RskA
MKLQDPRVREILAGEYVLGTLQGSARQRFERWLREDAALRREVEEWEQHLNPLALAMPPVKPPPRVWRVLKQRIKPARERRWLLWDSLVFWRTVSVAASALVMGIYIRMAPVPQAAPIYIVVLNDSSAKVAWLVSADLHGGKITIKTQRPQPLATGKSFELWMLPGSGPAPRSLGLIPASGRLTMRLSPANSKLLRDAQGLAVSLEPAGGSPSGLPTGPVLYQGPLLSL